MPNEEDYKHSRELHMNYKTIILAANKREQ